MKPAVFANSRNTKLIVAALTSAGLLLSFLAYRLLSDPDIPFLLSENGAVWVRPDRMIYIETWRHEQELVTFNRRFKVDRRLTTPILVVRAFKDSEVRLDGQLVLPFKANLREWKKARSVNLAPFLSPGEHQLQITVVNRRGPALLLAHCADLRIFTGPGWNASYDRVHWGPAQSVETAQRSQVSRQFQSTTAAFVSLAPFQISLFAVVFALVLFLYHNARYGKKLGAALLRPSRVRWFLLLCGAALAANNVAKLSLTHGFDVPDHYEYIAYIAQTGRLPLASEGWQMFQSPLYYLISAVPFSLLSHFFTLRTVMLALRAIPLICGLLQIEVCYRAMRHVFPERQDLQILGTLVGGFIPMNLYMSQFAGNEPLAALLTAVILLLGFALLTREQVPIPSRLPAVLGIMLGLAVLTKVSAILLVVPLLGCFIYAAVRRGWAVRSVGAALLTISGFTLLITGWFHLRNWIMFGKPFVGGWDPVRGIAWWQDPGYRTVSQFFRFREALIHPVFSGTNGFWDSIYSTLWADGFLSSRTALEFSPPWNYRFMFSAVLLAVLPTVAILWGMLTVFRKTTSSFRSARLFAAACLVIYFSAVILAYASVPIYSAAKATYTLGLLPCYAVLCAAGLESMMRGWLTRLLIISLMVCWAINGYLAFFVVS